MKFYPTQHHKVSYRKLACCFAILMVVNYFVKAQTICKYCKTDTTGGYTSIEDTMLHNPILNFELLTSAHLALTHKLKIDRQKIPFFPAKMNALYSGSGDSRGHCIPYEDLAWSPKSAKASMDLNRNLAPQPQNQNIGTKLACEDTTRTLAIQYGSVKVYGGTWGTLGMMKGINKPAIYWTVIVSPTITYVYWMPTTGPNIGYHDLKTCHISYAQLVAKLGFDPCSVLK